MQNLVHIYYQLSEQGRRNSLASGGDGKRGQYMLATATPSILAAASVEYDGRAELTLHPPYYRVTDDFCVVRDRDGFDREISPAEVENILAAEKMARIAALEEALARAKAKAREDLAQARTEAWEDLTRVKEDLAKTQEDLAKAREDLAQAKEDLARAKVASA